MGKEEHQQGCDVACHRSLMFVVGEKLGKKLYGVCLCKKKAVPLHEKKEEVV
ncbi:MAG: hypothetical protein IJ243_07935 [Prevotella sp.]|nr:hypothetical protein [Prevotella sp.]